SGRIYVIYNQSLPGKVNRHRQQTGAMTGIYSDDDGDNWSKPGTVAMSRSCYDNPDKTIPAEWVVWQKPLRLAKDGKYLVGMTRTVARQYAGKLYTGTEFIRFENIDDNPEPRDIQASWFMTNENILSVKVHCEEPAIVKLPDGRL